MKEKIINKKILYILSIILIIVISAFTFNTIKYRHNQFIKIGYAPYNANLHILSNGKVLLLSAFPEIYDPSRNKFIKLPKKSQINGNLTLLNDNKVFVYRDNEYKIVDVKSNKVINKGTPIYPRFQESQILLSDKRIFIAGSNNTKDYGGFYGEIFDYESNKLSLTKKMNFQHGNKPFLVQLRNGRLLIAGGYIPTWSGGQENKKAELFDIDTGSFIPLPNMLYPHTDGTATLLQDGRVLFAGSNKKDTANKAELFDPKTNKFVETGSLNLSRYRHTATLLKDGKVLIIGGEKLPAELFDPKTGKFHIVASMKIKRDKPAAILLKTGNVLVVGGHIMKNWKSTAELYIY